MQISMCALDVEQGLTQAGAVEVIHTVQRGVGIGGLFLDCENRELMLM